MTTLFKQHGLYAGEVFYLQDALQRCLVKRNQLTGVFYETLFLMFPNTRSMFSEDTSRQHQMFATILESAAAEMMNPSSLEPLLESVGKHHQKIGVSVTALEMGRLPFLAAIEATIGKQEFDEHETDWNNLYSLIITIMKQGGLGKRKLRSRS